MYYTNMDYESVPENDMANPHEETTVMVERS
jgi:hypothetical protein